MAYFHEGSFLYRGVDGKIKPGGDGPPGKTLVFIVIGSIWHAFLMEHFYKCI